MTRRARPVAAFVLLLSTAIVFSRIGAAAVPPAALSQARPGAVLISTSAVQDGTRYIYEISSEQANLVPRWDARAGSEPPLTVRDARMAAETWLKGRAPEVKSLELTGVNLLRANPTGIWHYRLTYDPVLGGKRLPGGRDFTAVVLLDGSIVEPRTEPFAPGASRGAPPAPAPGAPVRVGGPVKPPQRIRNVNPVYPPEAQSSRAQGVVIIEVTLGTDGHVIDARVVRSIPLLDAAALAAVKQWEYEPARLDGVAVPVIMTVTVNFTLQ